MRLFPAIDIQGGRCVRLRRGDFADETVFADDPVAMAVHWQDEGAQRLHVVDLDGARSGAPANLELIARMVKALSIPVQLGGGLRTVASLSRAREAGVARVVLGTAALLEPALLHDGLEAFGEGLVVAVDAQDGYVRTHGWTEPSSVTAADLVARLSEAGVREVLYTDIARDGMMTGPNVAATRSLAELGLVEVIASGGVTVLDDLRSLKELEPAGVTGVIVGRALYEGSFTLAQARAVLGD